MIHLPYHPHSILLLVLGEYVTTILECLALLGFDHSFEYIEYTNISFNYSKTLNTPKPGVVEILTFGMRDRFSAGYLII